MSSILKKFVEEIMDEIQQEESELEEMSTTGNVAGYNTPHAFKKTDGTDEDDEPNGAYVDKLNQSTGYKRVDENRWHELAKSEGTPKQKIGVGIRNINKQLSEMEQFINWYGKLKNESGMDSTDHWKRTKKHLFKIRERLSRISTSISKL
jgi:division protein CdvB (Snf7/Vps24/ESCRT-III family)